jgi:hypothetical protein
MAGNVWRRRNHRRAPKVLRRLKVTEGSLVGAGACPGAQIVFHKSAGGGTMDNYQDVLKVARERPVELSGMYDREEVADAMAALAKELHPDLAPDQALAAAWGTRAMSELYALHQDQGGDAGRSGVAGDHQAGARACHEGGRQRDDGRSDRRGLRARSRLVKALLRGAAVGGRRLSATGGVARGFLNVRLRIKDRKNTSDGFKGCS